MEYNVDFDKKNILIVQNDTWAKTYSVKKNNVLFPMTGMKLDLKAKDEDGVTVLTISSAGVSPAITIMGSSFSVTKALAFPTEGKYFFDLQLTNAGIVSTIWRGWIKVLAEYTD
jgi:hypothetical protein